ncbi:hypothetical protein E8E14_004116 [Neopestalotiopsis sp. 37M]|nr:hypothetical protein E8E14_004116 [Neopestalotiopsis sp. 37M]
MKAVHFVAVLGASLAAATSDMTVSTTVICSSCPNVTSTAADIVTRSPVPTTPCTAPALTVISSATAGSSAAGNASATYSGSPSTTMPVTVSGGEKLAGGFGGALALAAAVAYLV